MFKKQHIIVTGRSGSGKSHCLHALEDLGFYCVDNLPLELVPNLFSNRHLPDKIAISIDARNIQMAAGTLREYVQRVKPLYTTLLYVDAQDDVLLKRFNETRRKHPLTNQSTTLKEALSKESELLSPLLAVRDILVDTSYWSPTQLSAFLRSTFAHTEIAPLLIQLHSFGFKHGPLSEADYVFDVRCLPNPYWDESLRGKSGADEEVIAFFQRYGQVGDMVQDIGKFLIPWIPVYQADNRCYLTVGIGCTGGKHRSVYIAEQLSHLLQKHGVPTQVRHRDWQR
ncbi:MAG: RNase adapter RapZ [Pseudomonadota bacterium]